MFRNWTYPKASRCSEVAQPFPFTDTKEAVVVGAQLTEFTDAVSAELRAAIADSILLAQLAANKVAGETQNAFRWYDKYVEVLQNLGWQLQEVDFNVQSADQQDLDMHKAIIPVIMAMLGPQAAAVSIVLAVLNGLKEMDRSTPWITLFDRSSQHAHGAKFLVSHVDADEYGQPKIALLSIGIRASKTITQVLFFKVHAQEAEVKTASGQMTISPTRLDSAKEAIAARVLPFISDYVAEVEI